MAAFFGNIKGYYVEVGANDPRERSQTWHLEQQGWTGVLRRGKAMKSRCCAVSTSSAGVRS